MPSFNTQENSISNGQQRNIFPRPVASGSVGGADSSIATRAHVSHSLPPLCGVRNGALSERTLVTLGRNDSMAGGLET